MRPVKIAFVVHSMQAGGAERSVARLVNALDFEEFKPLVICLTKSGAAAQWIDSSEVPVIEINKKNKMFDLAAVRMFVDTLRESQVDLVHSHNWGTLVESSLATRKLGIAHVHAERGTVLGQVESGGFKMRLRGLAASWAMRRCASVVTNSKSVVERIGTRCWFPEERVEVIPNGVEAIQTIDSAQIEKFRSELGIGADDIVLGSVGRLVPVKGFELAIEATQSMLLDSPNYHLILVGDGPERSRLEGMANDLKISKNIHLVGHQDDIGHWLSLMDLYVNTSHSEGMSQSIVEAMSAGLPIIAADVGDSNVLIGNGDCGCLVPPNDLSAFVSAINLHAAPTKRKAAGTAAQVRQTKYFGIQIMAERYKLLYLKILGELGTNQPEMPNGL